MRRRLALTAALGLALCAGLAAAQTPIDQSLSKRDARRLDNMEKVVDELRSIVFRGRDTKQPVVVQPADTDSRLAEIAGRLGDLEQTLTRVNGSLETTSHQLDEAKRANAELAAQVKALTDRLAADEQKLAAAQAPPPAPAEAQGPPSPAPSASPAQALAQARQLMLAGSYDQAEAAFRDYVANYPDEPRAPEARYWWGKTLQVRGAHAEAATAFIGAIRGWPKTAWAPDALVELARELTALKKTTDACQTLAELPRKYPKTSASVKARAAAVRAQAKCG